MKSKCKYCKKEATRSHNRHDNGVLENLCEKHYAEWEPKLSTWKGKVKSKNTEGKKIYTPKEIKEITERRIKKLSKDCVELREVLGLKKNISSNNLIINSLGNLKRSLERRIKQKKKKLEGA